MWLNRKSIKSISGIRHGIKTVLREQVRIPVTLSSINLVRLLKIVGGLAEWGMGHENDLFITSLCLKFSEKRLFIKRGRGNMNRSSSTKP